MIWKVTLEVILLLKYEILKNMKSGLLSNLSSILVKSHVWNVVELSLFK